MKHKYVNINARKRIIQSNYKYKSDGITNNRD